MSFEGLLQWGEASHEVAARIERNPLPLKILLKTKDDPEMLRDWIAHHRKIVGVDGLIIFDNMSTHPDVAATYAGLEDEALVVRFSGFQDIIHHTKYFSGLYDALRASCLHFVLLDTDERLTLFDGQDHFRSDPTIISFLADHPATNIFPGTWLQNVTGYRDRFNLWHPVFPLTDGLLWGKPVVATSCDFRGYVLHNTLMDHSLYSEPIVTNFFILHLKAVSNRQRLASNLLKLKSSGAIPDKWGAEEILERQREDWNHLAEPVKAYVEQIVQIHEEGLDFVAGLGGSIQIAEDGLLICTEDWQRQAILDFLANPPQFIDKSPTSSA